MCFLGQLTGRHSHLLSNARPVFDECSKYKYLEANQSFTYLDTGKSMSGIKSKLKRAKRSQFAVEHYLLGYVLFARKVYFI